MPAKEDDPRRFLHPETIAKITRLELRARQVVEGFISGMHRSPIFGHSIEFVQHREYTAGDDIRHLDWKVWSKTDRFYIKQYEAETNLRCHLIVDVSESMHYGRGPLNKYAYGCTAGACLAYLLLRQQDAVGCITFDSDVRHIVPARSQMTHIDAIVKTMNVSKPREKTDIDKILRRATETLHSRSMIVLISDLLIDREPLLRSLEMLTPAAARHSRLPRPGRGRDDLPVRRHDALRGHGGSAASALRSARLREGYLEALEEYLTEVRRGCTRIGIDYHLVRTSDYLDAVLTKFLHHRMDDRFAPAVNRARGPQ